MILSCGYGRSLPLLHSQRHRKISKSKHAYRLDQGLLAVSAAWRET
jgi:hypothetical protein